MVQNDPDVGVIAILVPVLLIHIGCLVVCGLKGKWGVVALSVLVCGFLASVPGACRLARPSSWWARRFYDVPTMDRAITRFVTLPRRN